MNIIKKMLYNHLPSAFQVEPSLSTKNLRLSDQGGIGMAKYRALLTVT